MYILLNTKKLGLNIAVPPLRIISDFVAPPFFITLFFNLTQGQPGGMGAEKLDQRISGCLH